MTHHSLPLLEIDTIALDEQTLRVVLHGEIDMSNAQQLRSFLEEQVKSELHELQLDVEGIEYADSSGISLLVALDQALVRAQQRLVVALSADHSFRQTLRLMGVDKTLTLRESLS